MSRYVEKGIRAHNEGFYYELKIVQLILSHPDLSKIIDEESYQAAQMFQLHLATEDFDKAYEELMELIGL